MNKPRALDRLLYISVQCHDFITVMCQVQHRCPVEVRTGKINCTQFELHPFVVKLTDICKIIQKTGSGTDRAIIKQVLCIAVVVFEIHKDTVNKSQAKPNIQIIVLFPFQFGIGLSRLV